MPSLPPGLEGEFVKTSSGGEGDWLPLKSKRLYTNAFIVQAAENDPTQVKILLGYKKRGFGVGLYNGFGGKVEPGETTEAAAMREMQEECGITAPLEHVGSLLFILKNGPEWAFQIELYRADSYTGTIAETDEMRPEWFNASISSIGTGYDGLPSIPFDNMWPDDVYWMPHLLAKKQFSGRADFETDAEGKSMLRRWWFGVNDVQ